MLIVRHRDAPLVSKRQCIAINKSHFIVIISQRATGQEPAHARADDDCMPTEMRHLILLHSPDTVAHYGLMI